MYEPTMWVDDKSPDVNEDNLNKIEQGIKAAHDMAEHNAENIAKMAGNQMPEEYLKKAVDNYVKDNSGGFATQAGMAELESQLSGQIESAASSLNSEIADLQKWGTIIKKHTSNEWEYGNLTLDPNYAPSGNAPVANNSRIRTKVYDSFSSNVIICVPSGYKISIATYDNTKTIISTSSAWITEDIKLETNPNYFYRYLFTRVDGASMSLAEGELLQIETVNFFTELEQRVTNLEENKTKGFYKTDILFLPKKVQISGHRGDMAKYPENTIPAFESAGKRGCWGIETDIRSTSDGILVCLHNDDVDTTTDGSGKIQTFTFEQSQALNIDFGEVYGNYSGETLRIPTFEQYLKICKKYGCVALIHCQVGLGVAYLQAVYNMVKKYNMLNSVVFQSWEFAQIEYLRTLDENILLTPAYNEVTKTDVDNCIALGNCGFHVTTPSGITGEVLQYAKDNNVIVFGGINPNENETSYYDAWVELGVDNITNTYLDLTN